MPAIPVIAAVASVVGTASAIAAGTATVLGVVGTIGAVAGAVGAVTGNKRLTQIGAVVGLTAGALNLASSNGLLGEAGAFNKPLNEVFTSLPGGSAAQASTAAASVVPPPTETASGAINAPTAGSEIVEGLTQGSAKDIIQNSSMPTAPVTPPSATPTAPASNGPFTAQTLGGMNTLPGEGGVVSAPKSFLDFALETGSKVMDFANKNPATSSMLLNFIAGATDSEGRAAKKAAARLANEQANEYEYRRNIWDSSRAFKPTYSPPNRPLTQFTGMINQGG